MTATQVIVVAVKNVANMKIFVKTPFMVVVLLQSESAFLKVRAMGLSHIALTERPRLL